MIRAILLLLGSVIFLSADGFSRDRVKNHLCLSGFLFPTQAKARRQEVDALRELGLSFFRMELSFPPQERERIQVRLLQKYGIETIGIVRTSSGYKPPSDLHRFSEETRELGDYFRDDIRYFEIWNEQNAGYRFWKPREDPSAYAILLKTAYIAIKKVAPKAEIIYGGLFYHPQGITGAEDFLEKSFQEFPLLRFFFDALAFHPYPIYPPTHPPDYGKGSEVSLPSMVSKMGTILRKYDTEKPLFLTELGWPVYGRVTEKRQASYLVRAYALALAMPRVKAVCWYTLRDSPHKPNHFPPEGAFGLLHSWDGEHYRPKLSFFSYRALSRLLGRARFQEDLRKRWKLAPSQYAFLFTEKKREIILYWEGRRGRSSTVAAHLGSQGKVLDMFGQTVTFFKEGSRSLQMSNTPRYLLCRQKCMAW